ncbi:hypothetical protein AYL99_03958 [Fonsecaea erecta]|uniref:Glutamate--cysteine ligase n=1 Tax=Fonsecaea erecta TaxID=1367422 RepID=A0A178ZRW6_9EURO|nr:hypothetical protein AYL99_03958 [Fonsecaea erecta]OAP61755.1 hypothetical protein AYL99_03958 [Fonsecaea erecta]
MEFRTNQDENGSHWAEVMSVAEHIRRRAIQQLLDLFEKYKDIDGYPPLWGDEIEYQLLAYDDSNQRANLLLKQKEVLNTLERPHRDVNVACQTATVSSGDQTTAPEFQPEFGSFMVEATPGEPYDSSSIKSLLSVEPNMRKRRRMIQACLGPGEAVVTMPGFPRLGAPGLYTEPALPTHGLLLRSQFLPDGLISTHERYGTIHDNIDARRGGRPCKVKIPIYRDKNTPWPWKESLQFPHQNHAQEDDARQHHDSAAENFIYGDSMAFGPSFCGLQVTTQARNLREARYLHDQLCPLGPVIMALSAASPFFRGFLTDTDVRWNQAATAVDDRTTNELRSNTIKPFGSQARWSSTAMYISDDPRLRPVYNPPEIKADSEIKRCLQQNSSMDALLASHYANILTRDPIALTKNELRSYESLDLFEILHSAVWPHVDFKLPSKDGAAGWRVEFRPLEVQLTDLENAAFAVFMALLARTIQHYDLNFYIPIEKVAENMERAHTRNAAPEQKFFFRLQVEGTTPDDENPEAEYALMTMAEIINGSPSLQDSHVQSFPGLLPLVQSYVLEVFGNVPDEARQRIDKYLDIIRRRATGEMLTPASWMRLFVQRHPDYRQDSVVSERVCYDLMKVVRGLGEGSIDPAQLFSVDAQVEGKGS